MVTTNTSADLAYGKSAWGWQALLVAFVAATWTAGLYDAFGAAYTIQDDARHFVAFMVRWLEPTAFAGDPMADYFLGAAPLAYRSIHWVAAQAGLDPLFTNRLLPPLLGGWTAYAAFRLGSALGGSARAGVLVALFTTLIVGATDTLAAGTPRGLAVPLLLSFLAACVSKRTLAIAATMVLLALSYPQAALLAAGTLALQIVDVSDGIRISRDRGRWWQTAICIFVTVLALAPFALRMDGFGPAITAEEARRLPLMQAGGSVPYFADSWWQTILCGKRAGLLVMGPACQAVQSLGSWAVALVALVGAAFTFGLPILLWRRPKAPGGGVVWLLRLLVASLVLFAAAHVLLFALHLPSRYSQLPGILVVAIAIGLAVDRWIAPAIEERGPALSTAGPALALALVALPFLQTSFPMLNYKQGHAGGVYAFLRSEEARPGAIATLSEEAGMIPAFAHRSVVSGRQYLVPYSTGYFSLVRTRSRDLLAAHGATQPGRFADFVERYGVAYVLIEAGTWTPEWLADSSWANDFPGETAALERTLTKGPQPLLKRREKTCTALRDGAYTLVDAACVTDLGSMQ